MFKCPKPSNKFCPNLALHVYYTGTYVWLFVRKIWYGTFKYSELLYVKAGRRRLNFVRFCLIFWGCQCLPRVTHSAPRILIWLMDFLDNLCTPACIYDRHLEFLFTRGSVWCDIHISTKLLPKRPFFFYWRYNPLWVCILQPSSGAVASSHTRFLDHTLRRATVGRTPSGRLIIPLQRPLPDNTQHSTTDKIHAPGGIRTHDRSRQAAVDLRLKPRGYWDRHQNAIGICKITKNSLKNWTTACHTWCVVWPSQFR